MEYYLIHKDEPAHYLLIGTESFGSFWPDQGLQALMKIVYKDPDEINNIQIKVDSGEILTVGEFVEKLQDLKVRTNG